MAPCLPAGRSTPELQPPQPLYYTDKWYDSLSMSDPKTLDEAYKLVEDELLQMFLKKHKDYGKGNILAIKELGIALRISEKIERIKHLTMQGTTPTNESIEETWIDIGVYSILAVLLRRGWFEKLEVAVNADKANRH